MRALTERYAVAAAAFLAAAVWLGVGVVHAFACLVAFIFVLQAVRLYQRRSDAPARGRGRSRSRRSSHRPSTAERPRAVQPPSRDRVYDTDREGETGWQVSSEPAW